MSQTSFFTNPGMAVKFAIQKLKTKNEYPDFLVRFQESPHTALLTGEACSIYNKQFAETPEYNRNRMALLDNLLPEFDNYDCGICVMATAEILGRVWSYWLESNDCKDVPLFTPSMMRFSYEIASEYEQTSPMLDELFAQIQKKCMGYNFHIAIPTLVEILIMTIQGMCAMHNSVDVA